MAIDRYTVEERYTKRTLKRGFTVASYLNYITTMGRKRTSNNTDLVQPKQYIILKNKRAKIPPLES